MAIKAIETVYKGYRFRSRLEARWAVAFDALGLRWDFEKEGFDLGDAGKYLPDFWIPEWNAWVEIKPAYPAIDERKKCLELARQSGQDVFLFDHPDFNVPQFVSEAVPGRDFPGAWARCFRPKSYEGDDEGDFGYCLSECSECLILRTTERYAWPSFVGLPGTRHWQAHSDEHGRAPDDTVRGVKSSPRMQAAYAAAKSARFEFGEHGSRR